MKSPNIFIVFAIALLFCSFPSSAQRIHFADTSNYWVTYFTMSMGSSNTVEAYYRYSYKDTMVNVDGHQYAWLSSGEVSGAVNCLIREEGNKIYLKPLGQHVELYDVSDSSQEFVYFDYDLAVGDTLRIPMTSGPGESVSEHVVLSIDSVLINNIWHKQFDMDVVSGLYGHYTFTEGIGTYGGPIMLLHGIYPDNTTGLICFRNGGTNPVAAYTNCSYNPTGIREPAFNSGRVQLYPNPANEYITISYQGIDNPELNLIITDPLGRVAVKSTFTKEKRLVTHSLPAGLYILRISRMGGDLVLSDKLVITR